MTHTARYTAAVPLWIIATAMLAPAGPARAQAPLLEVEKGDATRLLQVNDDAGFLVRGAFASGTIPAAGAGVRLMWFPRMAAFRAGIVNGPQWDEDKVGSGSVGLGSNTTASGAASLSVGHSVVASGTGAVALGVETIASGDASFAAGSTTKAIGRGAAAVGEETQAGPHALAAGFRSTANGPGSLAAGHEVVASGNHAAALGALTEASGPQSFAAGLKTKAVGAASVALGAGVTAQGNGSFAFGDNNTSFQHTPGPNEFWVRAFGGIGLNTGVGIGCDLPPNTGAWACTSSKLVKEAFEEVDGEEILARLKEVPIQRWRYIGTEARHVGPFAEDFHAAFGLGDDATKIAQIDADGVALSAVQALERRTAELQAENAGLRAEAADLERRVEALERAARGR